MNQFRNVLLLPFRIFSTGEAFWERTGKHKSLHRHGAIGSDKSIKPGKEIGAQESDNADSARTKNYDFRGLA